MQAETELTKRFEAHLQNHQAILRKVSRAYAFDLSDQQDLSQEILIQLWKSFPAYDAGRSFSTWMFRIALNTAITFRRAAKRVRTTSTFDAASVSSANEAQAVETSILLERILSNLDDLDRALLLMYCEQYAIEEIAEVLGISAANVTTRMSRLRQRLRRQHSEENV